MDGLSVKCRILLRKSFLLTFKCRRRNAPFLFLGIFRRISSKFYFCQIFYEKISTKNFSHFTTLNCYHTKSLKSNFLTPKSYSAPATVKFYTMSNFERANKLQTSWKAGKLQIFRKEKLELHFLKKRIFGDRKI